MFRLGRFFRNTPEEKLPPSEKILEAQAEIRELLRDDPATQQQTNALFSEFGVKKPNPLDFLEAAALIKLGNREEAQRFARIGWYRQSLEEEKGIRPDLSSLEVEELFNTMDRAHSKKPVNTGEVFIGAISGRPVSNLVEETLAERSLAGARA